MSHSSPESSSRSSFEVDDNVTTEDALGLTNLRLLGANDQVRELQTVIRDSETTRSDFIFYTNRLIRLMVEEGLNCLPSFKKSVTTPTGYMYEGEWFEKMNCAVSILRSGEAMEIGLRDCCRSMRVGKILIRRDQDTKEPKVYYAKFPPQIEKRKILLLHPVLETGATVRTAITVLKEHGVLEKNVVLVTLFSTAQGAYNLLKQLPDITMLTSEVHSYCPSHFAQKYFGSD